MPCGFWLAFGRLGQGGSLVVMRRDAEGPARWTRAMDVMTAKEVSPLVAGCVYCAVLTRQLVFVSGW